MNSQLQFIAEPTAAEAIGTPEELSTDERMVIETVRRFVDKEVLPHTADLEAGDVDVLVQLLRRAAEIGLTGVGIPEEFGGMGATVTTAMLASTELGRQESFATSIGAHVGIGSMPLMLFGSDALKRRYLPELATLERVGAYALTEPGAGSDAMGLSTRARRTPDGSGFEISGVKQFITNAPIAGLLTVFAQLEGEGVTAFVVPGDAPGVTAGPLEHKMGMRGSPTASVTFEAVTVPTDHVLGEVGKGHRVAFNILNIGRIKLGFGSLGCARDAISHAAVYAMERKQFGRPIGEFGLIRDKLAEMAAAVFLLDGVCLRLARALDGRLPGGFHTADGAQAAAVLKDFAVPSALLKLLGSEVVAEVADEAVQIHGGYGFIEDYAVCRIYRDVRVNRIFEGTNEINRLLAAGGALKGGMAGAYPLPGLLALGRGAAPATGPSAGALAHNLRWAFGRLAGHAMSRYGVALQEEQQVLGGLADLLLALYALDTADARLARDAARGGPLSRGAGDALLTVAADRLRARALKTLHTLAGRVAPEDASTLLAPFLSPDPDAPEAREQVAARVLARGGPV